MLDLDTLAGDHPDVVALVNKIAGGQDSWPLKAEKAVQKQINTWQAIASSDKDVIREIHGKGNEAAGRYRIDPLGERIADTWAAFLFGDEPRIEPAEENDKDALEELLGVDPTGIEASMLTSELEEASAQAVAEGETWARIYLDEDAAHPLLEWHSRKRVVPLFVGRTIPAAALETTLPPRDEAERGKVVCRLFEVHAAGIVLNVLFKGKENSVGERIDLEDHADTADLDELWDTGVDDSLLVRVPNRLRGKRLAGISDYVGILDFLLDLNEAAAIGAINMRLSARKRAVVSAATAARGGVNAGDTLTPEEPGSTARSKQIKFDADEDVFVADPLDGELGSGATAPFQVLEYSFDAAALIAWQQHLVASALGRAGLTGQYVGASDPNGAGYAISGTALRLRMIPTNKTGRAKGRYWDSLLPRILRNMQILDAALGHKWADPTKPPKLVRAPGIPVDDVEEATRHGTLVREGLESVETAIRTMRPHWTNDQVNDELERLAEARNAAAASSIFAPA